MIVQGQIKGLKKGTLYLQKMKDTLLVSVDSVALLGKDTFTLTDNVDSPVLYYLTFDGNTTDKRILFFGEKVVFFLVIFSGGGARSRERCLGGRSRKRSRIGRSRKRESR